MYQRRWISDRLTATTGNGVGRRNSLRTFVGVWKASSRRRNARKRNYSREEKQIEFFLFFTCAWVVDNDGFIHRGEQLELIHYWLTVFVFVSVRCFSKNHARRNLFPKQYMGYVTYIQPRICYNFYACNHMWVSFGKIIMFAQKSIFSLDRHIAKNGWMDRATLSLLWSKTVLPKL